MKPAAIVLLVAVCLFAADVWGAEPHFFPLGVYENHLMPDGITQTTGREQLLLGQVVDRPHLPTGQSKTALPIRLAMPTADGVVVTAPDRADLASMSAPWLLFWYGPQIHSDPLPYGAEPLGRDRLRPNRIDRPMLVICTQKPQALTLQAEGVQLRFADAKAKTFALALHGRAVVDPRHTAKWSQALPRPSRLQAERLTDLVLSGPSQVRERFAFVGSDLLLEQQFVYRPIQTSWNDYKPLCRGFLPPCLALAMQWGSLPARVDKPLLPTEFADTWGPLVLVDSDRFTIRLPDTARFVWQARHVDAIADSDSIDKLRAKLADEVARMRRAGRLAPVRYWFGEAWVHYFFRIPLETTAPSVQIAKALEGQSQREFVAWFEDYLEGYPPLPGATPQGRSEGKRREWAPGHAKFAKGKEMTHAGLSGLQMAMVLEDAAEVSGRLDWARKDWQCDDSFIRDASAQAGKLDYRTWTRPRDRVRLPEPRDAQNGPNVLTGGLIAAARLQHQLGHRQAGQTAAAGAIKTLVSHATYPGLLGAWYIGRAREEYRPSPERVHFRYIVPRIARDRPYVYRAMWGNAEYQLLTDITPEIARFWRSLPAASVGPAAVEELYKWAPDWYLTDGEPSFHIAEMSRQPPDCAHALFRGQAWVLQADPDMLAKWIDIPFCRVGDLWQMEKMALTIQATGKTRWIDIRDQAGRE